MIFGESLRLSLVSLRANKLRSFLTLLGIIIGVTAVIAVVAIVQGLNRYVADKLLDTGSNVSYLDKYGIITTEDAWEKAQKRPDITLADADALREQCPHVAYVVVQNASRGRIYWGRAHRGNVRITGTTEGAEHVEAAEIDAGRRISREDVLRRRPVIVLGSEVVDGLFGERDPIGRRVRVAGRSLEVIGVFKKQGGMGWTTQDNAVQIPYGLWEQMFGRDESPTIMFKPNSQELAPVAQDEVRLVMRRRHHLRPAQEDDFGITSSELFLNFYRTFTAGLYGAMIGIAALSLIVGGIVVMNIMLVSVTERTREIGIRKSVGARRSDIMQQFLIESSILAGLGGLLGIILGASIAKLIDVATPLPTRVEWWSAALGLFVSSSVGLFFGLYPASRAARLDPIEALRYE
jgi:putative ABC transport system permease protein